MFISYKINGYYWKHIDSLPCRQWVWQNCKDEFIKLNYFKFQLWTTSENWFEIIKDDLEENPVVGKLADRGENAGNCDANH